MTNERLAAYYQERAARHYGAACEFRDRYAAYMSWPRFARWVYGPSPALAEWHTASTLSEAYACTARLLMGQAA
jgi:hypothetical protein